MDIHEFVKDHDIGMTSRSLKSNPNMDGFRGNHYTVKISRGVKSISVAYSMGVALIGKPKIDDVLDCLASDASGVENARNFEDWAGDYGYDTDSRKAETIYTECKKQAQELRNLLSDDLYQTLLYEVDRM